MPRKLLKSSKSPLEHAQKIVASAQQKQATQEKLNPREARKEDPLEALRKTGGYGR